MPSIMRGPVEWMPWVYCCGVPDGAIAGTTPADAQEYENDGRGPHPDLPPVVRADSVACYPGTLADMQIRLGRGDDATGVIVTEPILVGRRTVVTMVEAGDWAVELTEPLKLETDDYIWIRGAAVFVQRPDSGPVCQEGEGVWLCR